MGSEGLPRNQWDGSLGSLGSEISNGLERESEAKWYGDLWALIGLWISSTLAWKIPWTEEPGGPHAVHGVAKTRTRLWLHFHFSLSCIGEGNGNPLQCSCLENPRDRGASWAAVYGVAQSQTGLKRLSKSSSRSLDLFWMWWKSLENVPWFDLSFWNSIGLPDGQYIVSRWEWKQENQLWG